MTEKRLTGATKTSFRKPNSLSQITDAPDMVVASHRNERNSPEYIPEVLQALAEVRNEETEKIAKKTTENACQVLNI